MVTGGGRNLGRAIVLALARDGFDVVVNTRGDAEQAEKVAAEAREHGVAAAVAVADVADPAAVERMFAVADGLGPLRVLVHNAALRTRIPVYEVTIRDWNAVRAVTLDGAFHCVLAALPRLRASGGGRIITMIGANALHGDPGRVHVSAANTAHADGEVARTRLRAGPDHRQCRLAWEDEPRSRRCGNSRRGTAAPRRSGGHRRIPRIAGCLRDNRPVDRSRTCAGAWFRGQSPRPRRPRMTAPTLTLM